MRTPILFELGDLDIGECGDFSFKAFLDCNSEVGLTHCVESHIYPDSTCSSLNAQWDGSSVELAAECMGDSVVMRITNSGWGDMATSLQIHRGGGQCADPGQYLPTAKRQLHRRDGLPQWRYHRHAGAAIVRTSGAFFTHRFCGGVWRQFDQRRFCDPIPTKRCGWLC